jgi:adenylate cyclase
MVCGGGISMSPDNTSSAILFVDICESVKLFEKRGDVPAQEIVAKVLGALSDVTRAQGGTVVKTIGDELLCSFPEAANAVRAACGMQTGIAHDTSLRPENMEIRVGIHYGPVVVAGGDVYGDSVNVAARAVKIAKAREIICTDALVRMLPPDLRKGVRFLDHVKVRGKEEAVEICEYLWDDEEADGLTLTCAAMPTAEGLDGNAIASQPTMLVLEYFNQHIEVSDHRPIVHIGRADQNDLVVRDGATATGGVSLVSRRHASVECRKGHFVLCDHSRNGTGVQLGNGKDVFVHRQDVSLIGDGIICIGRRSSKSPERLVQYRVVSS